jgi:penicillin G amidase
MPMPDRGVRRVAAAALCAGFAALAAASAAPARIIKAQSISPPGESGFVSAAGLLNGTGSPHLYDQQQLFVAFRRLGDLFGHSGQTEIPRQGVVIVRDAYGIPSITAGNDASLWWGVGYATAQDRLFELEVFRRGATGHLAEILGKSYLDADIETRRDFYTSAQLDRMASRLPASLRARYVAYRDGINAWVARTQADPSLLPGEFAVTGDTLKPFTLEDLYAIGVNLARTTPNGDGNDLADAAALDALGPSRFNRILPLRIPGQISTIPREDGLFPSVPGRTATEERAALARSARFVRGLPLPVGTQPSGSPGDPGAVADKASAPIKVGGSSAIAVRDPRRRRAFLFSGPELGFQAPSQLYQIEVHRPGLDARGVTIPGAPIIGIGHNAHVAWGLTSGLSQTNTLYAERLAPGSNDRYLFRGRIRTMSCRNETFTYHTPPAALIRGQPNLSGTVTERLCATVHGPVQARAGKIAYARRYATWGQELQTIVGLAQLDEAHNVGDVNRAAATLSWNENVIAADDHGNIGYWHPGLLPVRPKGWDERLPYPGTGQAEWHGFLPVAQRPHVIDPRQGWLTNWNTLPSQGWTTGNDPASERVAGPWFRDALLSRLTVALLVRRRPSFALLEQVIHVAGSTAQQRPLAGTMLRRALRGARPQARIVLRAILAWDGSYNGPVGGRVAPGVAAWQAFKFAAQRIALSRLGRGAEIIGGGGPNNDHVFDVSLGQAYALRTLGPAGWRAAAGAAFRALAGRFKSADPARWRERRALAHQPALGAELPPPMPFFDRGTWEQLVELGR